MVNIQNAIEEVEQTNTITSRRSRGIQNLINYQKIITSFQQIQEYQEIITRFQQIQEIQCQDNQNQIKM